MDFRYADEEDINDIYNILINSYNIEFQENNPKSFRTNFPLSIDNINENFNNNNIRWLIIETQKINSNNNNIRGGGLIDHKNINNKNNSNNNDDSNIDDEIMIGCCQFELKNIDNKNISYIHYFGIEPKLQSKGIGTKLLNNIEFICSNLNVDIIQFNVIHWREDIITWLNNRGYNETGGALLNDDEMNILCINKPYTRWLYMTKQINNNQNNNQNENENKEIDYDQLLKDFENKLMNDLPTPPINNNENTINDNNDNKDDNNNDENQNNEEILEDLVTQLMFALRTDEGKADFERMIKEEKENNNNNII